MSNQWREKPVHFFKCNCPYHKKILGQTYEKHRIRSDLGTSEENLTPNLRKTFDQCSIRSFGLAVLDKQITRYTRRLSPQLCSANYPLQYPHIRILPPAVGGTFARGWDVHSLRKTPDINISHISTYHLLFSVHKWVKILHYVKVLP